MPGMDDTRALCTDCQRRQRTLADLLPTWTCRACGRAVCEHLGVWHDTSNRTVICLPCRNASDRPPVGPTAVVSPPRTGARWCGTCDEVEARTGGRPALWRCRTCQQRVCLHLCHEYGTRGWEAVGECRACRALQPSVTPSPRMPGREAPCSEAEPERPDGVPTPSPAWLAQQAAIQARMDATVTTDADLGAELAAALWTAQRGLADCLAVLRAAPPESRPPAELSRLDGLAWPVADVGGPDAWRTMPTAALLHRCYRLDPRGRDDAALQCRLCGERRVRVTISGFDLPEGAHTLGCPIPELTRRLRPPRTMDEDR